MDELDLWEDTFLDVEELLGQVPLTPVVAIPAVIKADSDDFETNTF